MALDAGVGTIVVDNFGELRQLTTLTTQRQQPTTIMLRIAPGISAHTQAHISICKPTCTYGIAYASGRADKAIKATQAAPYLKLVGIHCHIG
ncbi:diaminopimelate decarboxylase, partial [Lactiplantibacillus plantarum]